MFFQTNEIPGHHHNSGREEQNPLLAGKMHFEAESHTICELCHVVF